ncbi:Emc2p ASCRUDRAFT_34214 [Ascoidea rubescens DSM 1968]|uniref:ER membrane protein complex subunit 2 n=1 Tax=Ascoidea rubescens DSM 1968 TaxID=1344418 RepID=A0A1D2VJ18_9ASCO|nr:hypothetical protein ASCRUDRAFT_34214 [Ascoidea rubescens DSM 1968]ODV61626.1 hypothetical protein ASCRUDRAFT_34214 [Ascoidea rubescens DSM 1968]
MSEIATEKKIIDRLLKIYKLGLYNTLPPSKVYDIYFENSSILNTLNLKSKTNDISYYTLMELQFYICLIIDKSQEAKLMLERLMDTFSNSNNEARHQKSLGYLNNISKKNYHNSKSLIILKRKIYLSNKINQNKFYNTAKKSPGTKNKNAIQNKNLLQGLYSHYITDLTKYLEINSSDSEGWNELSDIYYKLGNYEKAIYCLEEILINFPFAYNIYAKLASIYLSFSYKILFNYSASSGLKLSNNNTLKNYLKSIELSESYLNGWSGIYSLTSISNIKNRLIISKFENNGDLQTFQKLNKLADKKINEIIEKKQSSMGDIELAKKVLEDTKGTS